MTNVEALKALYVALGGAADDVANVSTIVGVLNAIAAKYEGQDDATLNPEAIANITAVLDNIIPDPTLIEKSITANGEYVASSDNADGYSSVSVNVPAPTLTGFSDVTLSVMRAHGMVGYYNNDPTTIVCVAVEVKSNPYLDFTVLGWVEKGYSPTPVM